jgi:uncharacterized membrane protein
VGAVLILGSLGALLAHQGHALRYAFPALAMAGALLLYRARPTAYLSLVWWLWILTPEVRRLSDYQAGYDSLNPIMLAPLLAGGLCIFTLLRQARAVGPTRLRGFALVLAGLGVATVVGLFLNGTSAAMYGFATWAVPPLFAAHLALSWRQYPEVRRSVLRTSLASAVVISVYGLVQFFVFPSWDRYWGLKSGIGEYLNVHAKHFRPFSTLNSAGPFAFVLVVLLIIVFQHRSRLRGPVMAVGVIALAITQVRSAWGVFVFGIGYLLVTQRQAMTRSLRVLLVIVIPVVALGLQSGPVAKLVDSRFHTVKSIGQDESFNARISFFQQYLPIALLDPIGHGIASTTSATKLVSEHAPGIVGTFDNGFLDIPFTFGWLGTILYVWGSLLLMGEAMRAPPQDPLVASTRAIGVAAVLFLFFGSDLFGVQGFFVWVPLGVALSARIFASQPVAESEFISAGSATQRRGLPPRSSLVPSNSS